MTDTPWTARPTHRDWLMGKANALFDLFQRNETSRGVEGSGLGLAIVREVAQMHGGEVTLSSEPGVGSTFVIDLPLAA